MKLLHFKGIHIVSRPLTAIFSLNQALAVTVLVFVFYDNKFIKARTMFQRHETIHIQQIIECGILATFVDLFLVLLFSVHNPILLSLIPTLFFYFLYLINYLINLAIYKKHYISYRNICFEKEAYNNEHIDGYYKNRKMFSWIRYIKQ